MADGQRSTAGVSTRAAVLLVALVVLSPWPFGSTHLRTTQAIALVGSLAALLAAIAALRGARAREGCDSASNSPPAPAPWTPSLSVLLGLWTLALAQLVPLPGALHVLLAPGSAAVWRPVAPAAAAVLGVGFHPVSVDPASTARWLAFSVSVIGLALAAAPSLRSRATLLRAAVAVVGGGLLVALYGLVARLFFADKLYGVLSVPTIAPFGPFVSKNHFAGYVELAACLAVGLAAGLADEARHGPQRLSWLESRRAVWVIAAWGVAAVLVLAVPVSLSRGGVVSLAAGLSAFVAIRLFTRPGRRVGPRTTAFAVSALLLVVIALELSLPDEARARVRTLGSVDQAGAYRIGVWRDSLRLTASSPLVGSGFGAYADALPRFKTGASDVRVEHAENDFLELLAEGGVIGGGLAALAIVGLLANGWRTVRDEPHRLARGVRAGALAGLAAVLVHGAFDFNLRIPSNALLAGLLLACVLAPARVSRAPVAPGVAAPPPTPNERRGSGPFGVGPVGFVTALFLAVAIALLSPWTESHVDADALRRTPVGASRGLRGAGLERDVVALLRRRPADASGWAALAWLRLPRSPDDAASFASWSQTLDPQYLALRQAARRIFDAAHSQPRRP